MLLAELALALWYGPGPSDHLPSWQRSLLWPVVPSVACGHDSTATNSQAQGALGCLETLGNPLASGCIFGVLPGEGV